MPREAFAVLSGLVKSNAEAKKGNRGLRNICQHAPFPRSITPRGVTGREAGQPEDAGCTLSRVFLQTRRRGKKQAR